MVLRASSLIILLVVKWRQSHDCGLKNNDLTVKCRLSATKKFEYSIHTLDDDFVLERNVYNTNVLRSSLSVLDIASPLIEDGAGNFLCNDAGISKDTS